MTSSRAHLLGRLKLCLASGLVAVVMVVGLGAAHSTTPAHAGGIAINGTNYAAYTIVSGPTPTAGTLITDPLTNQAFSFTTTTAGSYIVAFINAGGQTGNIITVSGPIKASVTLSRGKGTVTQTLAAALLPAATTGTATFSVSAFPH